MTEEQWKKLKGHLDVSIEELEKHYEKENGTFVTGTLRHAREILDETESFDKYISTDVLAGVLKGGRMPSIYPLKNKKSHDDKKP